MATRNTFAVFCNLHFLVSYNINIHTEVIPLELYFPRESYTEH